MPKCPLCSAELTFVRDYGKNKLRKNDDGIKMVFEVDGQFYSCTCTDEFFRVVRGKVLK